MALNPNCMWVEILFQDSNEGYCEIITCLPASTKGYLHCFMLVELICDILTVIIVLQAY